jgi:hypothetical protein
VCGFERSAGFNPADRCQQFRGHDFADRSGADPREDIHLQAALDALAVDHAPTRLKLGQPFQSDGFETIGGCDGPALLSS